jgi:phosphoglycerol transferase MdoB-like AlkP superfamily enzyme
MARELKTIEQLEKITAKVESNVIISFIMLSIALLFLVVTEDIRAIPTIIIVLSFFLSCLIMLTYWYSKLYTTQMFLNLKEEIKKNKR